MSPNAALLLRYSDFIVRELDLDGKVIHLKDMSGVC